MTGFPPGDAHLSACSPSCPPQNDALPTFCALLTYLFYLYCNAPFFVIGTPFFRGVGPGENVKRLRGNLLGTLKGGSRGVLDLSGDELTVQLPAGTEQRFQDAEWEKSPLANLLHVEQGQGGRFFFDLVVEPDEIDEEMVLAGDTGSMVSRASSSSFKLRQTSSTSDRSFVDDAAGRLYDHDDDYLRILSLSFRRARTDWQVDREKLVALLMNGEADSVSLWSADMALEGVDDDDYDDQRESGSGFAMAAAAGRSAVPAAPAYLFRTTWLPYSRLICSVADYRLLGPPWRITQYLTGTMKRQLREEQENAVGATTKTAEGAAADADSTESWEIAMSTVRKYLRSPHLSIRFAVSVSVDAADEFDERFYYSSSSESEQDDAGDSGELGDEAAAAGGGGGEGEVATAAGGGTSGEADGQDGRAVGGQYGEDGKSAGQAAEAKDGAGGAGDGAADGDAMAAAAEDAEEDDDAEEEEEMPNVAFAFVNWHEGGSYRPKARTQKQRVSAQNKQGRETRGASFGDSAGESEGEAGDGGGGSATKVRTGGAAKRDAAAGTPAAATAPPPVSSTPASAPAQETNALVVQLQVSLQDIFDDLARINAANKPEDPTAAAGAAAAAGPGTAVSSMKTL